MLEPDVMLVDALRSIRLTTRSLRRRPLYAVLTTALLALGIGAATAIIAVLAATGLRPLPYADPQRLYALSGVEPQQGAPPAVVPISALQLLRWRTAKRTLEGVEVVAPISVKLTGAGEPEPLQGANSSAGLFRLLGVTPIMGRDFRDEEEAPGSGVVIVSHGFWTRRFGRSPAAIGQTLVIDDEPRTIIGVMPEGFTPLLVNADVFVPLPVGPTLLNLKNFRYLSAVGRLRPEATAAQGKAELDAAGESLGAELPAIYGRTTTSVVPLDESLFGAVRPRLIVVSAAVVLLLVIAGANVVSLSLADALARRTETMTRLAIGAGRARIARGRLAETMLLAVAGGAIGIGIGRVALGALQAIHPNAFTGFAGIRLDAFTVTLAAAAALVIGVLTGAPAAIVDVAIDASSIATAASRATSGRGDRRLRDVLLVAQVAVAVVLLVAAGLLTRNAQRVLAKSPGFDVRNTLVVAADVSAKSYATSEARTVYVERLLSAVAALPGVESAALSDARFRVGESVATLIEVEGHPKLPDATESAAMRYVSPDVFRTLRMKLVRGRVFDRTDRADTRPVVVVSQSFAAKYWPGQDPIGKRVRRTSRTDSPWVDVIGVVGEVLDAGLAVPLGPMMYLDYMQQNPATTRERIVVRTRGAPSNLARAVRQAIWSVDRSQVIEEMTSLETLMVRTAAAERFQALVVGFFAVGALVLLVGGIYAMTLHAVARRTRELGVRAALGANPRALVALVVRRSVGSALVGMAVGVAGATLGAPVLQRVLDDGITRADGPLIAVLCTSVVLAAGVASLLPARRALRIPLAAVLRS
jgi:putative ABC transport system permease protein